MRIISPLSDLTAFPEIPNTLPGQDLLKNHPAAVLFETIAMKRGTQRTSLEFKRVGADVGPLNDIRAIAGGMVDLAVRLTAEEALGSCEMSEYEMRICAPITAKYLKVQVDIDSTADGYATYCCVIYGLQARKKLLVAESQGTFLFRSAIPQTSTKQHRLG